MLNSRTTVSIGALSGGNNRATALSLNTCPCLATSFFLHRPRFHDSIEATTILTQGAIRVLLGVTRNPPNPRFAWHLVAPFSFYKANQSPTRAQKIGSKHLFMQES
jgi:hypothetical protein